MIAVQREHGMTLMLTALSKATHMMPIMVQTSLRLLDTVPPVDNRSCIMYAQARHTRDELHGWGCCWWPRMLLLR